jgi:hypothetical protein
MKQTIVVLLVLALVGGGLFWWMNAAKKQQAVPAAAEKSGTTTKFGTISSSGGRFYLQEAGQNPLEIDSYVVELSEYVGQTITVSGQYSGDTLFVGSVE